MICKCGHDEKGHYVQYESPLCIACANDSNRCFDMWHEFKQDNLRYLEELSNGRE
jgi:hypothetical protein